MASPFDIDFGNLRAFGQQPPAQPTPQVIRPNPARAAAQQAAAPTLRAPTPAPVLDTSRLPQLPPDRAMPAADAAAYNASAEGRATARQFAQEKFAQAGGGSKYVPPTNPAAGPTGAAPKPAMPSTGGLRRAAEGAKTWATSPGAANKPIGEATKGLVKGAGTLAGGVKSLITSPLAVASAGIYGAYDGFNTDTEQYAKRFGTENTEPGLLRDLGVRSLGVASDVGNALFLGAPKALGLYRDTEEAKQVAAQPPTAAATPAPTATPNAAAAAAPAPIPTANPNIGPHPDLTNDLAKVPDLSKNPPAGLREGAVYKTKDANGRTVYSGMNVKENAAIVDGRGANVGQLNNGPTMSLSGAGIGAPGGSMVTDAALSEARQAAAARGDWDAVAGSYGRGGFAGMQPQQARQSTPQGLRMDPANNKRVLSMIEQMARSPRARDRNAAAQLLTDLNKAQDRNAVDLQGQQTSADTSRYASDNSLRGSVYSADSSANTQLSVKQMEVQRQQAQRQAMAAAYQATGGNLNEMKKLMLANGYDPQVVEQSIAADNTATAANQAVQAKASDRVREDNRVFKDVDGKQVVDEEATQAKMDALRQVFSGTTTMDTDSYEQNAPMVKALGGIFDRARADTNFGVGAYMPWADAPQRLSAMPNWKGGKLSKTSGLKGAFTTGGLEKGNYIVEHNGREMNLGHLDDLQRSLIEEHLKTGLWTPDQTQK